MTAFVVAMLPFIALTLVIVALGCALLPGSLAWLALGPLAAAVAALFVHLVRGSILDGRGL